MGASSWVRSNVRTETVPVGLLLVEQSVPQLCAHTECMCVTETLTLFLCGVYVAMNTGIFVCRHSAKNSFKIKNHVMVTAQYEL